MAETRSRWSHARGRRHSPTDDLARVMGFLNVEDVLRGKGRELRAAIGRGDPLTKSDWRRALLATEIVFASAVIGGRLGLAHHHRSLGRGHDQAGSAPFNAR
jgi:hypothetical protein